jgi:hypothetical protein
VDGMERSPTPSSSNSLASTPGQAGGENWKRGATSKWRSMRSQNDAAFRGIESNTNAGTDHKSCGLHCQMIRAAWMRLNLPQQRVEIAECQHKHARDHEKQGNIVARSESALPTLTKTPQAVERHVAES